MRQAATHTMLNLHLTHCLHSGRPHCRSGNTLLRKTIQEKKPCYSSGRSPLGRLHNANRKYPSRVQNENTYDKSPL